MKPHELFIFLFLFLFLGQNRVQTTFTVHQFVDHSLHGVAQYRYQYPWAILSCPYMLVCPIPHATYPTPTQSLQTYLCMLNFSAFVSHNEFIIKQISNAPHTHTHRHTHTQTLAHSTCTCHFLIMHSLSINFFYDRVIFSLSPSLFAGELTLAR